jgi:hypothetical protein
MYNRTVLFTAMAAIQATPCQLQQAGPTQAEIAALLDASDKNQDDMSDLADQLIGAIVAGDVIAAQLKADLLAALSGNQALFDKATQLFGKSETTENKMRAGVPGVPPIGGTPLLASYADRASFDTALAAYTGPEAVNVDGSEVKAGTAPALEYFTHSDSTPPGEVNKVGPTS